jgi:hypothetical protein
MMSCLLVLDSVTSTLREVIAELALLQCMRLRRRFVQYYFY